ncbi:methylated-DNA--[protein]-cysteine S-methyltransferase [Accumulibacter sp.]|nr:methylated-DNA--[protein]-cysteine S-methyltransferase [Accumulibacter sp.]MDS4056400.1 methylated-DNA--[protein]-cysteine S-methyltransferase [Accumulibacter sp.]
MTTHSTHFDSPVGRLLALAANDAIIALHILGGKHPPAPAEPWLDSPQLPVFLQLRQELTEYFAGQRRRFEIRLAPVGSDFQQAAWLALTRIPYGQTRSYGQQAAAIGRPAAVRAVAAANGRNPIAIVVPCHRVIAANGALTGYAGGLHNKALLLRLEGGAA